MQLSSLKQAGSGSGQCLYEMSSSAQSKPLEQAELFRGSLLSDSLHMLWRNLGCLLWIKDMIAVSSHHVTLWQLPDILSNSVSHLLLHLLSAEETSTTWQLGDGRCIAVGL